MFMFKAAKPRVPSGFVIRFSFIQLSSKSLVSHGSERDLIFVLSINLLYNNNNLQIRPILHYAKSHYHVPSFKLLTSLLKTNQPEVNEIVDGFSYAIFNYIK